MSEYVFDIKGFENQMLEINLEPGQSIQAEKGAMTYMDESINMDTRLGENTSLLGAIKRRMSGEELLINEFTNNSNRRVQLALSPQKPSHIIMVPLDDEKPDLVCRPDTFLAGSPDVNVSITRGAWGPAIMGGSKLIMQKLHGRGQVFITGNGAVVEKNLRPETDSTSRPRSHHSLRRNGHTPSEDHARLQEPNVRRRKRRHRNRNRPRHRLVPVHLPFQSRRVTHEGPDS